LENRISPVDRTGEGLVVSVALKISSGNRGEDRKPHQSQRNISLQTYATTSSGDSQDVEQIKHFKTIINSTAESSNCAIGVSAFQSL
jgi:hypothetical protein